MIEGIEEWDNKCDTKLLLIWNPEDSCLYTKKAKSIVCQPPELWEIIPFRMYKGYNKQVAKKKGRVLIPNLPHFSKL